jgi:hypothetical protein
MKRKILSTITILVFTTIALISMEVLSQMYVYIIAKRGKLFKPDLVVGWKNLPNLNLVRLNSNGEEWRVRTDKNGIRGSSVWKNENNVRVLILGDSFAFGEGISINARFDSVIKKKMLSLAIINMGVMGYGTDQQLIGARQFLYNQRNNDIMIILTFYNDFYDILRKTFVGRAKPWFELSNREGLIEHSPAVTWITVLRDKSYILALLMTLFEDHPKFTKNDLKYAAQLYEAIIRNELTSVLQKSVRVIIAFHGLNYVDDSEHKEILELSIQRVCSIKGIECLYLDNHLMTKNDGQNFLKDGHWNKEGHAIVAELLIDLL